MSDQRIASLDWSRGDPLPFWDIELAETSGQALLSWHGHAIDEQCARGRASGDAQMIWKICDHLNGDTRRAASIPAWTCEISSCRQAEDGIVTTGCARIAVKTPLIEALGVGYRVARGGDLALKKRAHRAAGCVLDAIASKVRTGPEGPAWLVIGGRGNEYSYYHGVKIFPRNKGMIDVPLPEGARKALVACTTALWAAGHADNNAMHPCVGRPTNATLRAAERHKLRINAGTNVRRAAHFLRKIGLRDVAAGLIDACR